MHRHAHADLMHAYAAPTPPEFLELWGSAKEAWEYIWAQCPWLDEAKADGVLVGLVSCKIAQVCTLRHRLAKDPTSYLAANGQRAAVPEVRELEAAEAQLTAWLSALGLSPADRARLNLNASDPTDTLEAFRARKARHALDEVKALVHNHA